MLTRLLLVSHQPSGQSIIYTTSLFFSEFQMKEGGRLSDAANVKTQLTSIAQSVARDGCGPLESWTRHERITRDSLERTTDLEIANKLSALYGGRNVLETLNASGLDKLYKDDLVRVLGRERAEKINHIVAEFPHRGGDDTPKSTDSRWAIWGAILTAAAIALYIVMAIRVFAIHLIALGSIIAVVGICGMFVRGARWAGYVGLWTGVVIWSWGHEFERRAHHQSHEVSASPSQSAEDNSGSAETLEDAQTTARYACDSVLSNLANQSYLVHYVSNIPDDIVSQPDGSYRVTGYVDLRVGTEMTIHPSATCIYKDGKATAITQYAAS